VWERGGS